MSPLETTLMYVAYTAIRDPSGDQVWAPAKGHISVHGHNVAGHVLM